MARAVLGPSIFAPHYKEEEKKSFYPNQSNNSQEAYSHQTGLNLTFRWVRMMKYND